MDEQRASHICEIRSAGGGLAGFWGYGAGGHEIRTFRPDDTGGLPVLQTPEEVLAFVTPDGPYRAANVPLWLSMACFDVREDEFAEVADIPT